MHFKKYAYQGSVFGFVQFLFFQLWRVWFWFSFGSQFLWFWFSFDSAIIFQIAFDCLLIFGFLLAVFRRVPFGFFFSLFFFGSRSWSPSSIPT